jgi:hypothetical protein
MSNLQGVVPWKCPICKREFDPTLAPTGAGVCARCGRVMCRRHLKHLVHDYDCSDNSCIVCDECLKQGERTESLRQWRFKRLKEKLFNRKSV